MAALNLASPDELNRVALVAVELFDPVSLSLVCQGVSVTAKGLAGRPIISLSGRFVWLAEPGERPEDDRWPSEFVFDPGRLPYESETKRALSRPLDLRNPRPDEKRIDRIVLRPTAAYPFPDGITVVRGRLREDNDSNSAAIASAEVWLECFKNPAIGKSDNNSVETPIHVSVFRAKTNPAGGFAAFLRLPTDTKGLVDKGLLKVRIKVSRDRDDRNVSFGEAFTLSEGRLLDLSETLAWSKLEPLKNP